MILLFLVFLLLGVTFFCLAARFIPHVMVRVVVSALIVIALSVAMVSVVSWGHRTPPGAKNVDVEEMEKARKKIYGDGE